MTKDLKLFYHIWVPKECKTWRLLVDEQLKRIYRSGLPNSADVFCCINSENHQFISEFVKLYDWVDIIEAGHDDLQYEGFTLKHLHNHCLSLPETVKVGYIHTKGVHHFDNCSPAAFKAINSWRHFLEWGVIDRWRDGTQRLETFDVVGVNFLSLPWTHYSGNFWWSTAKHIRRLPSPRTFNLTEEMLPNIDAKLRRRIAYERWVCLGEPKTFSFASYPFRINGKNLQIRNLYEDDIEPFYRLASI